MARLPYSRKGLRTVGTQRSFGPEATQAAFLLGGIGTGNVSVGARGELRDWEIFNRSAKGQRMPYGFFSISVKRLDKIDTRVLEARLHPPLRGEPWPPPQHNRGAPSLYPQRVEG